MRITALPHLLVALRNLLVVLQPRVVTLHNLQVDHLLLHPLVDHLLLHPLVDPQPNMN